MKAINEVNLKKGEIYKKRIIGSIIIEEEQCEKLHSQVNFILNSQRPIAIGSDSINLTIVSLREAEIGKHCNV